MYVLVCVYLLVCVSFTVCVSFSVYVYFSVCVYFSVGLPLMFPTRGLPDNGPAYAASNYSTNVFFNNNIT